MFWFFKVEARARILFISFQVVEYPIFSCDFDIIQISYLTPPPPPFCFFNVALTKKNGL